MNTTPEQVPATKPLSCPRFGFITLFAISAFFQIVLAAMAINDGYFPTEQMKDRIPQGDWYWTANQILMPSFLITALVSVFCIVCLLMRRYSKPCYIAGIIATVMSFLPIGLFLFIPLSMWIRRRHHFS